MSFNAIYGQGMSATALQAQALGDRLARRAFRAAARSVETPWLIATGEDRRYPEVAGARLRLHGAGSGDPERVRHAATHDPVVLRRFMEVANLLAPPPSLMAPAVARRVLLRRRLQGRPAGSVPAGLAPAA